MVPRQSSFVSKWFLLVALNVATAAAQDQVVPLRGTPVSGTITRTSPTEVVVEVRGKERTVPVNEIRRVSFREDPTELKRGRDKVLIGRFASALDDLAKVAASDVSRGEVKDDIQFYLAYCKARLALSEGGDKAAATTGLLNFARQHPSSFHFFQAAETLGDLAVAQDKYDDAVRFYKAIATKSPWPDLKIRGAILEGRARVAQGEFAAAQQLFDSVTEFNLDTPEAVRQQHFATIGRAICQAELGSPAAAQQTLNELIAKTDPQDTELCGHAYNGLGRCYLKADQPKDALLAYLHVDILFASDPAAHAESLYHLSHLWKTVNRSDRAAMVRKVLNEKYAGSKWAKLD